MRKISLLLFIIFSSIMITYANNRKEEEQKRISIAPEYIPHINGTVRAKYELQTETGLQRFAVKNARISATGNVLPQISYKAEVDLSNEGKIRMLDAFIKYNPLKQLYFSIGQMRVPFTIAAHRPPHVQFFANRSFLAKHAGNVRDVGFRGTYTVPDGFVKIDAGIFCGADLTDQKEWHKEMNYSGKVAIYPLQNWNITASIQKTKPENIRVHMYDIGSTFTIKHFYIETEFLYKRYQRHAFKDVQAINAGAKYDFPVNGFLQKISVLGRFDYMSDHSNGKDADPETGKLQLTHYSRERATGGCTLSFKKYIELRVNYEKYFYKREAVPLTGEQDKVVIESVLRF